MLLVDKPKGLTSSQVVQRIKKKFNVKTGHTGTLDPLATGLLVVLTGKRTKNASLFLKLDKAYEVKAVLGTETDTFDSDGKVIRRSDSEVTREELEGVMKEFYGDIWQTPPPFSAKKLAGRKAYELARKGITVDIPPNKVSIYSLELKEFQFPHFTLTCEVSSGFYVRSLVHDIGDKIGVNYGLSTRNNQPRLKSIFQNLLSLSEGKNIHQFLTMLLSFIQEIRYGIPPLAENGKYILQFPAFNLQCGI